MRSRLSLHLLTLCSRSFVERQMTLRSGEYYPAGQAGPDGRLGYLISDVRVWYGVERQSVHEWPVRKFKCRNGATAIDCVDAIIYGLAQKILFSEDVTRMLDYAHQDFQAAWKHELLTRMGYA